MPINNKVKAKAREISEGTDQDIYILSGELERPLDRLFIRLVENSKSKMNALLILVTPGGNADAAYRITRCLQENYDKVTLFVSGWCKSAGTLCAIGAHSLIMSKDGELGPLDVQLGRKDDLVGYESGLEIEAALGALRTYVSEQFEAVMLSLIAKSEGRISVALASQISSNIATGIFSEIYSQIDPIKIGEVARSMTIAKDYGKRLAAHSENLLSSDDSIDLLVSSYSSHSFVIDFLEAKTIFKDVVRAEGDMLELHKLLGGAALYPSQSPLLQCLSVIEESTENDEAQQPPSGQEKSNERAGNGSAGAVGNGAPPQDSPGPASKGKGATKQASGDAKQNA